MHTDRKYQYRRGDFRHGRVDGPYIDLDGRPAHLVRPLVKEIGEEWPVLEHGGVGMDRWRRWC